MKLDLEDFDLFLKIVGMIGRLRRLKEFDFFKILKKVGMVGRLRRLKDLNVFFQIPQKDHSGTKPDREGSNQVPPNSFAYFLAKIFSCNVCLSVTQGNPVRHHRSQVCVIFGIISISFLFWHNKSSNMY